MARLYDQVTRHDVEQANQALYTDPLWEPGFSELWDVRGIRALIASIEDVYKLASDEMTNLDRSGTDRVAVIVARQIDYALVHLHRYHVRGTGRPYRIFWKHAEACTWLGVPAAVLTPPAV